MFLFVNIYNEYKVIGSTCKILTLTYTIPFCLLPKFDLQRIIINVEFVTLMY